MLLLTADNHGAILKSHIKAIREFCLIKDTKYCNKI
jgi:hypothetical protein